MIDFMPLLQTHGYWLLFLIMILEGGIIIYVGAFAASLGVFNIYAVLLMGIFGNIISDVFLFYLGRIGKKPVIDRIIKYFDIKKKRLSTMRNNLQKHLGKTLAAVKVVPPLQIPGTVLAGAIGIPFKKYMKYSCLIIVIHALFFTLLGFYSGLAFNSILKYLNYGGEIVSVLVVATLFLWYVISKITKSIAYKVEKL